MRIRRFAVAALLVTAVVIPSASGVAMAASKSPAAEPVSFSTASKSPMAAEPVPPSTASKSPMTAPPVSLSVTSKGKNPVNKAKKSSKTPR